MRSSQVLRDEGKVLFVREQQVVNASRAPVSSFFHNFFKVATLFAYFLIPVFSTSKILSYIFVIIFASFDFWVVKNISGRFLVGLRWWSEYNENEEEVWMFECRSDESEIKAVDSRMFWGSQIGFTLFWGIWLVFNIISFKFLRTISLVITFFLLALNTYAFFKCSKGLNFILIAVQRAKVHEIMEDIKKKGIDIAMDRMKASVKLPMGMKVI